MNPRFSRDRPRFTDNLDVIKFLCKDLWTVLFRKQIDNLKTNHRVGGSPCRKPDHNASTVLVLVLINFSWSLQGVYVLTDSSFRPFARMSMAVRAEAVTMAQAVRISVLPDPGNLQSIVVLLC